VDEKEEQAGSKKEFQPQNTEKKETGDWRKGDRRRNTNFGGDAGEVDGKTGGSRKGAKEERKGRKEIRVAFAVFASSLRPLRLSSSYA
jgi:hypothetical protein